MALQQLSRLAPRGLFYLPTYGCAAKLHLVASGTEDLIGTLDLSIQWSSYVGDLVYQVQAKLEDLLLGTYLDDKSESKREREPKVTFVLSFTPGQPGLEEVLLVFTVKNGELYTRAAGPDFHSDKTLLMHLLDQYEYIVCEICDSKNLEKPLVDLKAISVEDWEYYHDSY